MIPGLQVPLAFRSILSALTRGTGPNHLSELSLQCEKRLWFGGVQTELSDALDALYTTVAVQRSSNPLTPATPFGFRHRN
jgi:hypothetical protein